VALVSHKNTVKNLSKFSKKLFKKPGDLNAKKQRKILAASAADLFS